MGSRRGGVVAILAALTVAVVVAVAVQAGARGSGTAAPGLSSLGTGTHVGQSPSDHVVLGLAAGATGGCEPRGFEFIRVLPDGTLDAGHFRVPAREVLVVTDVDWQYNRGVPGDRQILRLFIENLTTGDSNIAFESTVILNAQGDGGISEAMTSGFVVSSAARICPDLLPGPLGPPFGLNHVILRGYLTAEK